MKKFTVSKTAVLLSIPILLSSCGENDSNSSQEENVGEALEYTITGIEPGSGTAEIARKALEEDMPEAFEILDRFEWNTEHMQEVMLEALERDFEDVTTEWVDNNRDLVDEWTEGIDDVDGTPFELGSIPWDTERSSANATAGAWLPTTAGAFMETYGENIVDLGPNLTGTIIGYVVPTYMEDINSIEDLPAKD